MVAELTLNTGSLVSFAFPFSDFLNLDFLRFGAAHWYLLMLGFLELCEHVQCARYMNLRYIPYFYCFPEYFTSIPFYFGVYSIYTRACTIVTHPFASVTYRDNRTFPILSWSREQSTLTDSIPIIHIQLFHCYMPLTWSEGNADDSIHLWDGYRQLECFWSYCLDSHVFLGNTISVDGDLCSTSSCHIDLAGASRGYPIRLVKPNEFNHIPPLKINCALAVEEYSIPHCATFKREGWEYSGLLLGVGTYLRVWVDCQWRIVL